MCCFVDVMVVVARNNLLANNLFQDWVSAIRVCALWAVGFLCAYTHSHRFAQVHTEICVNSLKTISVLLTWECAGVKPEAQHGKSWLVRFLFDHWTSSGAFMAGPQGSNTGPPTEYVRQERCQTVELDKTVKVHWSSPLVYMFYFQFFFFFVQRETYFHSLHIPFFFLWPVHVLMNFNTSF